jgi:alginate O-acetyltransferase complex protein AlgI
MIFSSVEFILFFSIFIISLIFFSKYQKFLIILFSLVFYSFWKPIFTLIIIYLIVSFYLFIKKNISLKIAIPLILSPLIYFKYSTFFFEIIGFDSINHIAYSGNLPLGISFITFTVIALLVDVKKKIYTNNLKLSTVSEFILYFPQLVAGPILRAHQLIPFLKKKISFTEENIKNGTLLFLLGFVKKIFFADTIAEVINPIFLNPLDFSGEYIVVASLLFPLQIYFDFSGYVDMALGISRILGISLPINFDRPYLSKSLTEFWRKWHITLSRWFRDYLYIPLGGSRVNKLKIYYNLLITMTIAGLWHGSSWNFLIWGVAHGTLLCVEKSKILSKFTNFFPDFFKIFLTCFVVFNLWIIFRISNLEILMVFYKILYSNILLIYNIKILFTLIILSITLYFHKYDNCNDVEKISKKISYKLLIPITASILITGFLLSLGTSEKFIYFDF